MSSAEQYAASRLTTQWDRGCDLRPREIVPSTYRRPAGQLDLRYGPLTLGVI